MTKKADGVERLCSLLYGDDFRMGYILGGREAPFLHKAADTIEDLMNEKDELEVRLLRYQLRNERLHALLSAVQEELESRSTDKQDNRLELQLFVRMMEHTPTT